MSNKKASQQSVPPDAYTREYFEVHCEGYEEYKISQGRSLSSRLVAAMDLADLKEGMRVLDIGCGRGEILLHSALLGANAWGIDYAPVALELAKETISLSNSSSSGRMGLIQSAAEILPFCNSSIDVVFMLDVVEHLYPNELETALTEVKRVLRPGGRIVVHTMPNLWYYGVGYPLYRILQGLRGNKLPANPRLRFNYSHVHVYEQTPISLYRNLSKIGFKTKVWVKSHQSYGYERNRLVRFGMIILSRLFPFRYIFANDIFAVAIK